jgi:ankyrin repeat protein
MKGGAATTIEYFAGGKKKSKNNQKSKKFKKFKKQNRTKSKSKKKRKSKKRHLRGGAGMLPVNSNREKHDLFQLGNINIKLLKYLNGIDENNTIISTSIVPKIEECLKIFDEISEVPRYEYIHAIKNDSNYNMLMLSIYNGFNEVSKYLIDICVKDKNQNHNPMFTDVANDGNNVILMAAFRGNKEIFDYLLYTANLDLVNVVNLKTEHNILHYACEFGHIEIIDSIINFFKNNPEKVIQSQYLLNQRSSDTYLNYTPLHCAAKQGQLSMIEKMFHLSYTMRQPLLITNQDMNRETPIHIAAKDGNHLLIECMLRLFIITTQPKDQSQYDLFNEYMNKIHPHQEYDNVLVQNMTLEEIEGIITSYNNTKLPDELSFLQNMREIIRKIINLENINLLPAYNLALTYGKQLTARFLLYHGADSDKLIPPGTTPLIPHGGKPLTFISSAAVAAAFDQASIISMGRDLMHRFKSKI